MENIDDIVLELLKQGLKEPQIRNEIRKSKYNTDGETVAKIIKRLKERGMITSKEIKQAKEIKKKELRNQQHEDRILKKSEEQPKPTKKTYVQVQRNKARYINPKVQLFLVQGELQEKLLKLYKEGVYQYNIARRLSTSQIEFTAMDMSNIIKRMEQKGIITDEIELERSHNINIEKQNRKKFNEKMSLLQNKLTKYELKQGDLIELREMMLSKRKNLILEQLLFTIKAHVQLMEFDEIIKFLQSIIKDLAKDDAEQINQWIDIISEMGGKYKKQIRLEDKQKETQELLIE